MATSEERLKILNMIAEGKLTPEEGADLLKALQSASARPRASAASAAEPRFLRVRVTSLDSEQIKANITIPMTLLDVGLRMGARFAPDLDGMDYQQVMEAIQHGQRGKIIDVEDDEDNERVEIFVE